MRRAVRGIVAFVSVILATLLMASGAQAATADQQNVANYVSSTRNAAGLPSLSVNGQMNSAAQAWADHLASVDNRSLSPDPNMFQPSGTTGGYSLVAYYSRNDPQAAMDMSWGGNANAKGIINTASWNTIGTGFAVAKSGAIYLVADLVHVNPPVVMAAPAPAPAPAPVVVPVAPAPAPAAPAPAQQAPAQADPAPAAPAAPEAAPEPAKPAATPTAKATPKPSPTATPSATATASPSVSASASASASAQETAKPMEAVPTSDTAPLLSKGSQQAMSFGVGGLLLAWGGTLKFRNRREKTLAS